MLGSRLVRMVLRVSPILQGDLNEISDRLFSETKLSYSYAAIIRGLIALGLSSLQGKTSLAAEFAGARVPRGRKRRTEESKPDEWKHGSRTNGAKVAERPRAKAAPTRRLVAASRPSRLAR
jgi:hypothetical protein